MSHERSFAAASSLVACRQWHLAPRTAHLVTLTPYNNNIHMHWQPRRRRLDSRLHITTPKCQVRSLAAVPSPLALVGPSINDQITEVIYPGSARRWPWVRYRCAGVRVRVIIPLMCTRLTVTVPLRLQSLKGPPVSNDSSLKLKSESETDPPRQPERQEVLRTHVLSGATLGTSEPLHMPMPMCTKYAGLHSACKLLGSTVTANF